MRISAAIYSREYCRVFGLRENFCACDIRSSDSDSLRILISDAIYFREYCRVFVLPENFHFSAYL